MIACTIWAAMSLWEGWRSTVPGFCSRHPAFHTGLMHAGGAHNVRTCVGGALLRSRLRKSNSSKTFYLIKDWGGFFPSFFCYGFIRKERRHLFPSSLTPTYILSAPPPPPSLQHRNGELFLTLEALWYRTEVNTAFCIILRTRNLCVSKMEPTRVMRMVCPQTRMMDALAWSGGVGRTDPRGLNSLKSETIWWAERAWCHGNLQAPHIQHPINRKISEEKQLYEYPWRRNSMKRTSFIFWN